MISTKVAAQATAIGSLPHRDPIAAAEFVLDALRDLPTIPSLPQRSPLESMLAQGAVGISGVNVNRVGEIDVRSGRLSLDAPIVTDLEHDAFTAFRTFLDVAPSSLPAVKWQVTGPVTLGMALWHLGGPIDMVFDIAAKAVRARIAALGAAVSDALPRAEQTIFVDEPALVGLTDMRFPLGVDYTIDLVSTALAAAEKIGMSGVHCCGHADWGAVLAAGPSIISMPIDFSVVDVAARLNDFYERGGRVAWGVVPTDRPVSSQPHRYSRALNEVWDELAMAGCDPTVMRLQSMVTPECGLARHGESQMRQVLRLTAQIGDQVRHEILRDRYSLGA